MNRNLTAAILASALGLAAPSNAQTAPQAEQAATAPQEMATVVVSEIKDRDTMPYADAFKQMNDFKKLAENDKIYLRFFAELKKEVQKKVSDVVVTVDGGDVHLPVKVEDDGTLQLPYSQPAFDAKAEILTSQGGGTLKIYYGPGIKVPATTTFKYRDIMDGVKQSTSMMKKFWFFLYPSFRGASLRYAGANGQTLTIQAKSGDEKKVIDPKRKSIVLALDPQLYEENPTVVVSELPAKILPFNTDAPKS